MHVSAQIWNIGGIVLSVCGVLILFRYGMPYRVRTGGANFLLLEKKDEEAIKEETKYAVLGWIGLFFVLIGAAFQIIGNLV